MNLPTFLSVVDTAELFLITDISFTSCIQKLSTLLFIGFIVELLLITGTTATTAYSRNYNLAHHRQQCGYVSYNRNKFHKLPPQTIITIKSIIFGEYVKLYTTLKQLIGLPKQTIGQQHTRGGVKSASIVKAFCNGSTDLSHIYELDPHRTVSMYILNRSLC